MSTRKPKPGSGAEVAGGFGVVDEKGRLSLPKAARAVSGVEPGTHVAFVGVSGALLVIPQDEHLADLMHRAQESLAASGLTVDDLMERLPAARASVVEEAYGGEFLRELARAHGLPSEQS